MLADSLSPVDLKALNPFENSSKVWKSVSKYISEQLTRTFAVLVIKKSQILCFSYFVVDGRKHIFLNLGMI